jgi:hypothetical protein
MQEKTWLAGTSPAKGDLLCSRAARKKSYRKGRKGHAMVARGSQRLRVLSVPIASFAVKRCFFSRCFTASL